MKKVILTTTASFSKTIEETDLKDFLAKKNIEVILQQKLEPPFRFDPKNVFGLVVGHNLSGVLVRAGAEEKKTFPNLKIVSPFGIGTDHIDFDGLKGVGVNPITLPHFSKRAVAELAIGFLFTLARKIVQQTTAIKGGTWERVNGQNIFGKTLRIIGLGNIGKETALIARAVGLEVLANDITYDEEFIAKNGIKKCDLKALIAKSDFITLHIPLTDLTRNLLDKKTFSKMKPGVLLINAARGEVVDGTALLEGLESGKVAGAGLDVFSVEPPFNDPILKRIIAHPNVIATPHVGAFTPEIRYSISKKICEELIPFAL